MLVTRISLAVTLAALIWLLGGFCSTLAWAGVLTVALAPAHASLARKGLPAWLASLMLVSGLILALAIPLSVISIGVSQEIPDVAQLIERTVKSGIQPPAWLRELPMVGNTATQWWSSHMGNPNALKAMIQEVAPLDLVAAHAGHVGTGVASTAFHAFLTFLTVGIALSHLGALHHYVSKGLTLLVGRSASELLQRIIPISIRGTALGLVSVALLEGIVLGFAYWIAGAPSPMLLAIATGYMALIPGGAPLSFTLVSLLLLALGNTLSACGLFAWGCIELFLVDKFVRPRIIGASLELPFLAVLFGLLGGIVTVGPLGLFVGPALVALLFSQISHQVEQG